jgi:hypothetical protein
MDGQAKKFRPALTFGFRLLSTAILISAGSSVQAAAEANNLNREFAGSVSSDRNSEDVEPIFSTESLFDLLFGQRENGAVTYDIPFPFTALTQRIAAHLAVDEGKPSSLLQVLIPLGRSLQRDAAQPEYFRYPRVIVAVDGNPEMSPDHTGLLLKDRLYLGYQEKANTIEVISYNEKAGRFEFQVVHDYAPGLSPNVSYASRPLCMGCHQNGGPIWSEPPWEETNSNPRIVSLLQEQIRSFQGVPVNLAFQGADTAFRIATSIDRANLFASHQQLWQHACGKSARCRGDLFAFMLQYRLSGNRGYDRFSNSFEDAFKSGWRERWPEGLPIQDPRIPNRDPLNGIISITGELDPLELRPSRISIRPSDAGAVESVIAGLSEFLVGPDIRSLDNYLLEASQDTDTARRILKAACAFTKTDLGGWALQVRFSCGSQDRDGLSMEGQFYIKQGEETRGTIERLLIGESEKLIKLTISGPEIAYSDSGGEVLLSLEQPIGGIHARLTNGPALERLTLRWNGLAPEDAGPSEELRRHPDNGTSVLSVVDDFARLRAALTALVQETENRMNDALSNKPIQGGALMRALFAQLGMKPRQWCCAD